MAANRKAKGSREARGLTSKARLGKRCWTWIGARGRELRSYFQVNSQTIVILDHGTGKAVGDRHHVRSYINACRLSMALAKSVR